MDEPIDHAEHEPAPNPPNPDPWAHRLIDPLDVVCPDCGAGVMVPCHLGEQWPTGVVHSTREDSARLAAVDRGSCALCHRPMVLGLRSAGDTVSTAWHPDPADADRCPVLPDPSTDWNAYAAAINDGLIPGVPGREHFRHTETTDLPPRPAHSDPMAPPVP